MSDEERPERRFREADVTGEQPSRTPLTPAEIHERHREDGERARQQFEEGRQISERFRGRGEVERVVAEHLRDVQETAREVAEHSRDLSEALRRGAAERPTAEIQAALVDLKQLASQVRVLMTRQEALIAELERQRGNRP
jgi:uncharacterized protein YbbK (DUF523 family)